MTWGTVQRIYVTSFCFPLSQHSGFYFPPFANANGPPFLSRTGNVLRSFLSYNFWFFAFYRKTFLLQMREANLPASYLLPPTRLFCTTLLPLRSMSNKKMQRMLHFFVVHSFYIKNACASTYHTFSILRSPISSALKPYSALSLRPFIGTYSKRARLNLAPP